MKTFVKFAVIIIAATLLPGCKPPLKVVGYSPGVEARTLAAFKTFSFYKLEVSGNKGPKFEANAELCKKAIAQEMTARGFTEADEGGALNINIGVLLVSNETVYLSEPKYTRLGNPKPMGSPTEGTITIEMVDSSKKTSVWIGSFSGAAPRDEVAKQERIKKGIALLFKEFPVKAKLK